MVSQIAHKKPRKHKKTTEPQRLGPRCYCTRRHRPVRELPGLDGTVPAVPDDPSLWDATPPPRSRYARETLSPARPLLVTANRPPPSPFAPLQNLSFQLRL